MIKTDKKLTDLLEFLTGKFDIEQLKNSFGEDWDITSSYLTKDMDVTHIKSGYESVLFVKKEKLAFCELNLSTEISEGAIQNNTAFLGTGEPYWKKNENDLFLFAPKENCEIIILNSKELGQPSEQKKEVSESILKNFKKAANNLDDYYFGYDKRYSKVYEAGADLWEADKPNESLLSFLETHGHLFEGQIIDLGCGEGRDSLFLAQKDLNVTGIDISHAALTKARQKALDRNLTNVTFMERDVIYLRNLENEKYDLAMNMGCLHMITEEEQRSKHIQRVFELLKPGGHFLIDHCQENWGKGFYSIPDYEKVAKDMVIGNSIPRRIRVDGSETEIDLEVLPYMEKKQEQLIEEVCRHGFIIEYTNVTNTEAFGNSALVLFKKPF
ncbi:class I SAM-dependent methyltransferase [Priestia megaterium]|uniref:class I SAM-dependent methyltransferase n=1 Tax=Priestia megaterium TaxID=1404 RepID=UPI00366E8F18